MKNLFLLLFVLPVFLSADVRDEHLGSAHSKELADSMGTSEKVAEDIQNIRTAKDSISSNNLEALDSLNMGNSEIVSDSLVTDEDSVSTEKSRRASKKDKKFKKPKLRKKNYNHRHQVGTALGMMVFITLILSLGSNINPR